MVCDGGKNFVTVLRITFGNKYYRTLHAHGRTTEAKLPIYVPEISVMRVHVFYDQSL